MNILPFYSLILLTILRIIGFGISIEFYFTLREKRFISIIIGWICWVITGLIPILAEFVTEYSLKVFLYMVNMTLLGVGLVLIFFGVLSYFYLIPEKYLFFISVIYLFCPLVLSLLGYYSVGQILAIVLTLGTYGIILITVIKLKDQISRLIGTSIKWLYFALSSVICFAFLSIILIFTVKDYSFGLFYSTNNTAIILNYSMGFIVSILLIVLFIHLERAIAHNDRLQLKDKYSHNIGNLLQIILSASELIVGEEDTLFQAKEVNIIREKCYEAAELVKEIRKI